MVIDYDTYKYEACGITQEECCGCSCTSCETAQSEEKENKIIDDVYDIELYTKFERESNISGIKVMVDSGNVIAKTNMETLKRLQDTVVFFAPHPVPYHPYNLKQYAPHLRKLRRYNGLGIPDMIWGKRGCPAAFLFGSVVYLIAPSIESE